MRRNLFVFVLTTIFCTLFASATPRTGIVRLDRGNIIVDMTLHLRDQKVKSQQSVVYTPSLVSGRDTVALESVGVYGRERYLVYERGNDKTVPAPKVVFKASKAPADYAYHAEIPYQGNLDGAELVVVRKVYGCASCSKGVDVEPTGLALLSEPKLDLGNAFVIAMAEIDTVKSRNLSGRANVEFPVNKTVLLPDFRGNAAELAKVRASIDSVRNDRDVSLKLIRITGFASPEGSFANNERLAQGRTEALRKYVLDYYDFPSALVKTAWVAEDWVGLRERVEKSDMMVREGLLKVIDDISLAPDAKDARLKSLFPEEYSYILKNIYPSLRHTDYRIEYTVRTYTDAAVIREIMRTRPDHLSLGEFCFLARGLKPDSDEYAEVMETAVKYYPSEPVANINAANVAMRKGDLDAAGGYLAKAGDSPLAVHSRGVYELLRGDLDSAETYLQLASNAGVPESQPLLTQVKQLKAYKDATSAPLK